jgi:hypothetical protein
MPLLGTSRRSLRCNNSAASHSGHVMDLVEPTLVSRWHSDGRAAGTSTSSGKPALARARSC